MSPPPLNEIIHGDSLELLPAITGGIGDICITDPPYGDTSLEWDDQVEGWIGEVARILKPDASMWVFGSMRFLVPLFAELENFGFKYSQDIVWKKQNGTGFHTDRFRRVHEHAVMFYRGTWGDVYHNTQYTNDATARTVRRKTRAAHWGDIDKGHYVSEDGGPRMMISVLDIPNEHGRAIHPTQKPIELLLPLVRYSCPPGGLIIDPFSGSGSTAIAAHMEGCDFIAIEKDAKHYADSLARFEEYKNPAQAKLFT